MLKDCESWDQSEVVCCRQFKPGTLPSPESFQLWLILKGLYLVKFHDSLSHNVLINGAVVVIDMCAKPQTNRHQLALLQLLSGILSERYGIELFGIITADTLQVNVTLGQLATILFLTLYVDGLRLRYNLKNLCNLKNKKLNC